VTNTEKYDIDRIFRLFLTVAAFGLLFFLIYYLRNVLIPFVIAFIIAYILDPVVDFFDSMRLPRIVSIIIVFGFIGILFYLIFFFGIPYIYNELESFGEVFPKYIQDFYEYFQSKFMIFSQSQTASEYFSSIYEKFLQNVETSQFIERLLGYLTSIFSQLFNIVYLFVAFVIIIMYVFFLLRDIDRFKERWHYYIPSRYRENVKIFIGEAYYYMAHFFRGQLTIVSILGILFAIGFTIVDIRLALLIGFTAGFLNLVPNFGTLIAIIPAVLLAVGRAAEAGEDPLIRIAGVLIVFLIVQIIQDVVLTPTIMGRRTGLRPATILFSVFIWGKLLGFLGIILAVPLTCLTKVYFARFILKEESSIKPTKKG